MKTLGEVLVPIGFLCFIGGLMIGGAEIFYWLATGLWPHLTLTAPFGPFVPRDWSGVSQILVWLWEQPLWAVVACASILVMLWGAGFAKS